MSRRIKQPYRSEALAQLTRQLLFAPAAKRVAQVFRAEKLHDEIDPEANYPFDYLAFRITGYRSEQDPRMVLVGAAILADLRLMIDALSRSVAIPYDEEDPGETREALAGRLGVSTKTLSRWRKTGLRWRWTVLSGRRGRKKQIVFPRQAVERFLSRHPQQVVEAAGFTRMDDEARQRLIRLARGMARKRGATLHQVSKALANQVGRAVETVRLVLQHHDRDHPLDPIFVGWRGPLTVRQQRVIARAHRWGVPVEKLAERFGRTPSTIHRAVRHGRAAALNQVTLRFVHSPAFDAPDADEVHLGPELPRWPAIPEEIVVVASDAASRLPVEIRELYLRPSLLSEEQDSLLARYNYLKYRAAGRRDALNRYEPRAKDLKAIESLLDQAAEVRNLLVGANLGKVLTVAKKHLISGGDAGPGRLVELLAAGNEVLYEAIETFNITKGRPFEAYLTWRLMERFIQLPPGKAHRQLDGEQALRNMRLDAQRYGVELLGNGKGALAETPKGK